MPKKRSECFLGMHFDFHAGINQKNIGENCDTEAIENLLTSVKPDYVQCDTKGHAGSTSYPTKVGYPAPEMKGDILKMWRKATLKYDIGLYAHHSGVWDNNAVAHHPEWAACDVEGNPSGEKISVFGKYADELLIPQLIEMANEYGLDGAWIDGECWAVTVDYSKYARDEYRLKYSSELPEPSSPEYEQFLKFCRDGFRSYIEHYISVLHKAAPHFQITSNWMYTSFMPEEPLIPLDFISGDYSPNDSVNTARFEGRCIAKQGKPWDLMAWGFSYGDKGFRCVKEYEQLAQEAASIIMLGGGFQFYNKQVIGTIQKWAVPMWASLAKFCREREALCHKAEFVPQVGIVYSQKAHYKSLNTDNKSCLFANYSSYINELKGTLFAVLDGGLSAEILMTHHVTSMAKSNLNDYGAIIISDLEIIEPELRSALLSYAEKGGNLIIGGYNSTQLFLPYLDIDIIGGNSERETIYIGYDGKLAPVISPWREVCKTKTNEAENIIDGRLYTTDNNLDEKNYIASSTAVYGKGKITGVYFNIGAYAQTKTAAVRDYISDLIKGLFTPAAVADKNGIEISVMKKDDSLRINLLNLNGNHSDSHYRNFDTVPCIYDINVKIQYEKIPYSLSLEPESVKLNYTYKNGFIETKIDKLHIHSAIIVK